MLLEVILIFGTGGMVEGGGIIFSYSLMFFSRSGSVMYREFHNVLRDYKDVL
jgi:hypothetical protein